MMNALHWVLVKVPWTHITRVAHCLLCAADWGNLDEGLSSFNKE